MKRPIKAGVGATFLLAALVALLFFLTRDAMLVVLGVVLLAASWALVGVWLMIGKR